MAMTASIPGQWPADSRGEAEINDGLHFITMNSLVGEEFRQSQTMTPYPLSSHGNLQFPSSNSIMEMQPKQNQIPAADQFCSREGSALSRPTLGLAAPARQSPRMMAYPHSPSIQDELFFECSSPSSAPPQPSSTSQDEGNSTSYLIFEPVIEDASNIQSTDWRRYDPPQELLRSQDGTSTDIRRLLAPSVERILSRHVEDEQRRAAAARMERPLARGRALVRNRRQVSMTGTLPTTHLTPTLSMSGTGDTFISLNDSGYDSTSPGTEPSKSPRFTTRRPLGLTALFKRKDRAIISLEGVGESSQTRIPSGRDVSPLPLLPKERVVPNPLTGECVSCLDDFGAADLIKLTCHRYCSGCYLRLINTALESETQWPPKCCLSPIPSCNILPHLNIQMKEKYRQREQEWSTPAGDRIYCSNPNCSTWIPPRHITNQSHSAKCQKCSHKSCTTCRGPYHPDRGCSDDQNLQATIHLAELEGWKRCFNCHALVEHNKGCRHMTCRCKAQFCYICGLRWKTCACTDGQLETIQQQARTRRQDESIRIARAAAEAEEERIAVQMVADFVRQEADLLAREAVAQRRREEEERRRREEERIAAVNLRFQQLTTELESLHDIQRVLIAERYEFETEMLKKDRQDALDTLLIRHPSDVQFLGVESEAKIVDSEHRFEREYQTRMREERRIEDEYVDELRLYWNGKPDAEYKVRDARDALRRDQDKEYRIWDAYRRTRLQVLAEGEKRKMESLRVKHANEIRTVEGRAKIDEVEWKRKIWAEGKWLDEVVRERIAMLGEIEQEAYSVAV